MSRIMKVTIATMMVLPMTGVAGDIRVEGRFISTVPTGTPPLEVSSTTGVPNLNADTVDGFHGSEFYTVAELASSGAAEVHFDNITNIPADGVKEINQDCATVGGCFDGDSGGFPVSISESGSYRLTSNLTNTNENANIIGVQVDDVTIDLNGFSLIGPNSCTGTTGNPVTGCDFTSGGDGVDFAGTGFGVTALGLVRNGVIRGMAQYGVRGDRSITVENVRITESGSHAIQVSNGGAVVRNSVIYRNGGSGITAAGLLEGNLIQNNKGDGAFVNPNGLVRGNQILDNGARGMRCAGCRVFDNVINDNATSGLELVGGASYGGNLLYSNGTNLNASGSNHAVQPNTCGGSGAAGAC